MTPHLAFTVADASQVGEARRAAARLSTTLGLDETAAGRVALVVNELGTNMLKHAREGRLLLAQRDGMLEVVSLDRGPGMADISACLRDGYSTAGTAGTGLGAVRRLADEFSCFSMVGSGTVVLARMRSTAQPAPKALPPATLEVGAIALAAPGETACGDGWSCRISGDKADVIVADGLGHGPAAAEAAQAALHTFEQVTAARGAASPARLLETAHTALRGTRGAAVAVARLDATAGQIDYCGVGNIASRVVSGIEDRSLMSHHGTVGAQMRTLQDTRHAWPPHAVMVMHSDGVAARWQWPAEGGLMRCDPVVIAGWLLAQHARGRDDATVVVLRRRLA